MKHFFIAAQQIKNGKISAHMIETSSCNNIVYILNHTNTVIANLCETKKECRRIVEMWNRGFMADGRYGF